jgi:hypothetical protein
LVVGMQELMGETMHTYTKHIAGAIYRLQHAICAVLSNGAWAAMHHDGMSYIAVSHDWFLACTVKPCCS